jgi:hypothetical protein
MWPLLVAVDGGRWCMIGWGVRPGIVELGALRKGSEECWSWW